MKGKIIFGAVFLLLVSFVFSACGSKEEEIHEHSYVAVEYEATCVSDGYVEYSCECGERYTEKTDDKLGHIYFWSLVSEEENEIKEEGKCVRCGDVSEKISNVSSYDYDTADTTYLRYVENEVPLNLSEYCTEDSVAPLSELLSEVADNKGHLKNYELCDYAEKIEQAIDSLQYRGNNITQIFISSEEEITNDDYVSCQIAVVPSDKDETPFIYDALSEIKVRGNSTALADKKGYNFKFSSKNNLFGFGEAKKWSLLANAYDKTLIRNKIALDLAKDMGIEYSPESTFVDVWLNGKFVGNFQLTESIEARDCRVDIDIENGDWLLEIESSRVETDVDYIITPEYGIRFAVNEPENITEEQQREIYDKIGKVETAIKSGDYSSVENVIDTKSFATFYVFSEFMKQVDFSYSSTRFYFKDDILYAGPGWDFDLSSGNVSGDYEDYLKYNNENGFGENTGKSSDGLWVSSFPWYDALLNYPEFLSLVKNTFSANANILRNVFQDNILGRSKINILQSDFGSSFSRNYTSAGWSFSQDIGGGRPVTGNYNDCVDYLRIWFSERYAYLDSKY